METIRKKILNLSKIPSTQKQKIAGLIDLPKPLLLELNECLTFNKIITLDEENKRIDKIVDIISNFNKTTNLQIESVMVSCEEFFERPLNYSLKQKGIKVFPHFYSCYFHKNDNGINEIIFNYTNDPLEKLVYFISDFSQYILFCSYNSEQIRDIWNNRGLTSYVKNVSNLEKSIFLALNKNFKENTNFDKLMDRLVRNAGIWPNGHLDYSDGLDTLTENEKIILGDNVFSYDDLIKRVNKKMNDYCIVNDHKYYYDCFSKQEYKNEVLFLHQ